MLSPAWAGDWPITQPWGPTSLSVEPLYGTIHWHCGVDVGMPSNTPLYAARAGVVSRTGFGVLGIQVGAESHYYIHIDRAVVGMGVAVATGQLIAYSGARVPAGGYLTGPHLHFERNPQPLNTPPGIDPMPLLAPRFSPSSGNIGDEMLDPNDPVVVDMIFRLKAIQQSAGNGTFVNPAGLDQLTTFRKVLEDRFTALDQAVAKVQAGGNNTTALMLAISELKDEIDNLTLKVVSGP